MDLTHVANKFAGASFLKNADCDRESDGPPGEKDYCESDERSCICSMLSTTSTSRDTGVARAEDDACSGVADRVR